MRNISEQEFDDKYILYKDLIYKIAYTYVHNQEDTDDITQDVFVKYLQSDKEFDSLDYEKYWLIRVTINHAKNTVTSSWKKKVVFDNDYISNSASNNDAKEKVDYYKAISSLPSKYKDVLILFYYEDMKINEIAHVLNLSSNIVKKRLERGREILKEEIENGRF